jgi:hypothetical protein
MTLQHEKYVEVIKRQFAGYGLEATITGCTLFSERKGKMHGYRALLHANRTLTKLRNMFQFNVYLI